jgi:hypothetical protein
MNRILAIASLTIATLAPSAGAFAQQLKANIPFDFTVGNTTMPAGEYTISSPLRNFVDLRSANRTLMATVGGNQSYIEKKSSSAGELIFARYGDQYFLDSVLCPSVGALNLDIAKSKAENRARARSLEAKIPSEGQKTLVAMR